MHRLRAPALLFTLGFHAAVGAAGFTPEVQDLGAVPLHVTPGPALQKALAAPRKNRPVQFAVGVPMTLTLADGRWKTLDAQTRSWRTRIRSVGAHSLNLEFSRYALPEGAALWLYDPAGRIVQGPYGAAQMNATGQLWTAIVPGEELVLELRTPAAATDRIELELAQVNHAFTDFDKADSAPAKSGACNIDVVCPQGNPWRKEIRAVARIQIGGTLLCSGQLVNNMTQDLKPLFLSADHCEIGDASTPAESVVFYWNYQTSSCGGTPNGSLTQNQTGSTLLADHVQSDFTLVRLNQTPASEFGVYYAGWNAGGAQPQSGVSIHHPSGDEKRISLYSEPLNQTRCDIGDNRVVDAWRVIWSEGTTEPGSSGSGLWDENHALVGTLSGGNASCEAPREFDCFARLDLGWQRDAASSHQLKAHLDPENTGCRQLPGRDPTELAQRIDTSQCTPSGSGGRDSGRGFLLGAVSPALLLAGALGLALRRRRKQQTVH